jgi:hypothetical protein
MKGLITFIDILGYQSFLENNSATDSALNVLRLVTNLPETVGARNQANWRKFWENKKQTPKLMAIEIEHLIFSDTIVLLYRYPSDDFVLDSSTFAYFSVQTIELMADLFTNGLPSRGVMHEGEFIIEGMCFAGRGIVEAYRACSELDFSGAVLTEHLAGWLSQQNELHVEHVFVDYLAPLKNGESKKKCLNWYHRLNPRDQERCDKDVIQFVSESFWAHRKDLPTSTDSKIRNTCKLIRKFKMTLDEQKQIEEERKERKKLNKSSSN